MKDEMPDFIPDADIQKYLGGQQKQAQPQGGQMPDFIADDQVDQYLGQINIPQKQPKFGPQNLQTRHAANVRAEEAAYKPGWTETFQTRGFTGIGEELIKDFGAAAAETPRRWAEMATSVPKLVMKTLSGQGAEVGMQIPEMIRGATEPAISPRTTGKALTEAAIDTAALGLASRASPVVTGLGAKATQTAGKAAQAVGRRTIPTMRAAAAADVGTNQLVAGLHPKNIKTARAVKSARADINEYMQRSGRDFIDSASFRDVASEAADDFYTGNYKPLADSLNGVPVQHQGALRPFEQLIERRGEINKTLGRLGYFDKSPLSRSLARTQPQVQKLVDELDEIKLTVNQAVDQMAPTNEGAAKILRRYADMKEVADVAKSQADRLELAKMIEAGEELPWTTQLGEWLKDAGISAATFGGNPRLINRWLNMVSAEKAMPALKREAMFARGAKNWAKGRSAMAKEHKPIQRLPSTPPIVTNAPAAPTQASIQLPGQPAVPASSVTPAAPAPYQAQYYPPSPLIAAAAQAPTPPTPTPVPPVQPSPVPSAQMGLPLGGPPVTQTPAPAVTFGARSSRFQPMQGPPTAQPVPPVQPSPVPQPAGPMATSAAGRTGLPSGVTYHGKTDYYGTQVDVYDVIDSGGVTQKVFVFPGESLEAKVNRLRSTNQAL